MKKHPKRGQPVRNTLLTICLTILACQYAGYKLLTSGAIQMTNSPVEVAYSQQDREDMRGLVAQLEEVELRR